MVRIVIDIPDNKEGFYLELLKNLGFVKINEETKLDNEQQENMDIPEPHQKLVTDRFNKVRKDSQRLLDWDDAKKSLKS